MEIASVNPIETSPTKPRSHWHWTTWCIGSLILLVCVMLNLGGDRNPRTDRIDHGWPWVFESRYVREIVDARIILSEDDLYLSKLFQPNFRIETFQIWILVANGGVALLVIGITCTMWEMRNRRLKRWYQFSLLDWFVFCALFAGGYAFLDGQYRDNRTEKALRGILDRHNIQVNAFASLKPLESEEILYDNGADVPYDWFWESLRIPMTARPYRRVHLYCPLSARPTGNLNELKFHSEDIPQEAFECLKKLRSLETFSLSIENTGPVKLTCLPTRFLELRKCPNLKRVNISSNGEFLSEEHLATLCKVESFTDLMISRDDSFTGHNLGQLAQIKFLMLQDTAVDEQGMRQIALLKNLETLLLNNNPNISTTAWHSLSLPDKLTNLNLTENFTELNLEFLRSGLKLKFLSISGNQVSPASWQSLASCKDLERLTLFCTEFDDEALRHLEHLPKLKRLKLVKHALTQDCLPSLKKLPVLKELGIASLQDLIRSTGRNGGSSQGVRLDPQTGFTPESEQQVIQILAETK